MGAAEMGTYVLAFSWCILLATLSHLGLASASLRVIGPALENNNPGLVWGFFRRVGQIVPTTGVAIATAGSIAIAIYGVRAVDSEMTPFLLAMTIVPILAFINVRCLVAVSFGWITLAFFWTEVIRPVSICIIVAAIWWFSPGLSASSVMSVQLAVMAVVAVVLLVSVRYRVNKVVPASPPEFETRTWIRIALPLLVISLFSNYFPEFMLILVGAHLPNDQVAIFNASYRLALIVAFVLVAVDAVVAPVASRLYATQKLSELQAVVSRATKLSFFGSVVAVFTFAVLGRYLLGIFGIEFVAGYETMMLIVAAQLVRAAAGPVTSLLSVTGHQDSCLIVFAGALIASLVLVFILVPVYGIRGAGFSVLLVTFGWTIWLHRLVVRHIGIRPSIIGALTRK